MGLMLKDVDYCAVRCSYFVDSIQYDNAVRAALYSNFHKREIGYDVYYEIYGSTFYLPHWLADKFVEWCIRIHPYQPVITGGRFELYKTGLEQWAAGLINIDHYRYFEQQTRPQRTELLYG